MSSFDPPLSRLSAAALVFGALLVCTWLLYAAHHAPRAATPTSTAPLGTGAR